MPFIETRYHSDATRRILIGHSHGGLFATCNRLKSPERYHTYVNGCPTLACGDRYVFRQEEQYARRHDRLPARVFVYAGDEEKVDDTALSEPIRFATILSSRTYYKLELVRKVFAGYDHCAVAAPGLHAGLHFALARP